MNQGDHCKEVYGTGFVREVEPISDMKQTNQNHTKAGLINLGKCSEIEAFRKIQGLVCTANLGKFKSKNFKNHNCSSFPETKLDKNDESTGSLPTFSIT